MTSRSGNSASNISALADLLQPHLCEGLSTLYRAHLRAIECSASDWDFAIDLEALLEKGLDDNDLRFLHHLDLVEIEERLRVIGSHTLGHRVCVILTREGVD